MKRFEGTIGLALFGMVACGGKAIIDDPLGGGGEGGSTTNGVGGSPTVTSNVAVATGGPTTTGMLSASSGSTKPSCEAACDRTWACAFREGQCEGFVASDEQEFIQDCITDPLCEAVASLIADKECDEIIATLGSLSEDFADACKGD
jgi:hypothetical protein